MVTVFVMVRGAGGLCVDGDGGGGRCDGGCCDGDGDDGCRWVVIVRLVVMVLACV